MKEKLAGLDPEAVRLAAIMVRHALSGHQFDHLSADDRRAIVAFGVEKIMAEGAFVRDGALFMPSEGQRKLLES